MSRTILIVEDEPAIVTLIKYNLEKEGFATAIAYDGEEGLRKAEEDTYDLILLDLMLPKMDGLEMCQTLRNRDNETPILMLTAKADEYDKVTGLDIGADDYLTKPFSPKELVSRINAILRRTSKKETASKTTSVLTNGEIKIDTERFEAYFQGELLELTRKEYELLVYLVKYKGQTLSREQLLHAVWDYDFVGDTRIVDVQVSHLRDKLELDTKKPKYIKTVRGFGYKMEGLS